MKGFISLLLVLAMLMSCLMLAVSAEEGVVSDEGRLPFEDVKDNHWFYQAVGFCYANGVIKGMNEYTFGFSGQLTRAQFVMMLCNLEGADTSEYEVTKFTDVKSTHWFYGAVAWAYNEGIVSGMTETTFAPNEKLNRAQLARIMHNYMQDKYTVEVPQDTLDRFPDKPKPAHWFYDDIKYAVSAGLISGMSDGTLASVGTVTRAQAAVIFKSFMEKYYFASCEHSFTEADCTNAAVCESCGFVNGLPKGHTLKLYNCTTGGACTVCGVDVAPSNLLHSFIPATCVMPRTCIDCNQTRGTVNDSHLYTAATCTQPKICDRCHKSEGKPLGHTTDRGYCKRCGQLNLATGYDCIAYGLMQKGGYDNELKAYSSYRQTDTDITTLVYYADEDVVSVENITLASDSAVDVIDLQFEKNSPVCTFVYMRIYESGDVFIGTGSFNTESYTLSSNIAFSEAEGGVASQYRNIFNSLLKSTLTTSESLAEIICECSDGGLNHLGFKVF